MFCPGCGKELKENQKFCPDCGMEIVSTPKVLDQVRPAATEVHKKPIHVGTSRKKGAKVGIIITLLVVTGLGIFGIVTALNWGEADGNAEFFYINASPSSTESIKIDVDVSDLTINYVTSPFAPIIEIQMTYHAAGGFVKDKVMSDLYNIGWDNLSAIKTFYMHVKPFGGWVFIHDIDIEVSLRTDIIYNIDIDISTGDTTMNLPDDITIGDLSLVGSTGSVFVNAGSNITFQESIFAQYSTGHITIHADNASFLTDIYTETSTGNIELNFTNSVISGDIVAHLSTGNFALNLYNPVYLAPGNWLFTSSTGSIYLDIYQHNQLTSDITGNIETSTGSIHLNYNGDAFNSGMEVSSSVSTGNYVYTNNGGFSQDGHIFHSTNYQSIPNIYSFDLDVSTGNIYVTGISI